MKIYLAGKIGKGDWRHDIVDDLRSNETTPDHPWPILHRHIFGVHDYTGPYFVACDHGGFHGRNRHGVGLGAWEDHGSCCPIEFHTNRAGVTQRCIEGLCAADLIFCWIDRADAYGTLVEIGIAHTLGKDIWIAGPEALHDLWFAYEMADRITFQYPNARAALWTLLGMDTPPPTNNGLQAIETFYNGYRFRSRTEARTAVFLDEAGIRYEFEPEGFQVGRGYLPDFWLPDHHTWLELKGKFPTDAELAKVSLFARALFTDWMDRNREVPSMEEQSTVHLHVGVPYGSPAKGHEYYAIDYTPGSPDSLRSYWMECPRCGVIDLRRGGGSSVCRGCRRRGVSIQADYLPGQPPISAKLQRAFNAARSARFEFGQTPQGPRS